uniref:Photosystem I assembly protein Ycf4 n=1 Tax=Nephroselmis astigmatica TaxID=259378 RepID=A0A088CKA9_9CHLO|nr:hypothetical chloroplast RF4 [Nephroselmis astigmatica]AID67742.1 hypothetical chloroplast RF4 [Nephroselmis astigmatica]
MTFFDSSQQTDLIRRDLVIGSRRFSNYWWGIVTGLGGIGFLIVGLSSRLGFDLLPFFSSSKIVFFPQGLVMCFYGGVAILISLYIWLTILWSVGGGYNEFNKQDGQMRIFRWGFPGQYRRIDIVESLGDIEAIKVDIQEGVNPRRVIYVRLKGQREIPLTGIGQPLTLAEIERQAADLAGFLQVALEGLS